MDAPLGQTYQLLNYIKFSSRDDGQTGGDLRRWLLAKKTFLLNLEILLTRELLLEASLCLVVLWSSGIGCWWEGTLTIWRGIEGSMVSRQPGAWLGRTGSESHKASYSHLTGVSSILEGGRSGTAVTSHTTRSCNRDIKCRYEIVW